MLEYFKKSQTPTLAIRLTSLAAPARAEVDRPALLDVLLSVWRDHVGNMPEWFDIFGPYGIVKGQSIGLNAFMSKLKKRGHTDYDGYVAMNEQHGGFCVSFFKTPPYEAGFCEIVLWFRPAVKGIDVVEVVRQIAAVVPVDYGYSNELRKDQDPVTESMRRRGLLGGITTDVGTNSLSQWHRKVRTVADGSLRDVYRINFLNRRQIERLREFDRPDVTRITDDLHAFIVLGAAEQNDWRKRLVIDSGDGR